MNAYINYLNLLYNLYFLFMEQQNYDQDVINHIGQTNYYKLKCLLEQFSQNKRIPIHIIGMNKNGKSLLCNELLKIKAQHQTRQTLKQVQIKCQSQDQDSPDQFDKKQQQTSKHIKTQKKPILMFPSQPTPMTAAFQYFEANLNLNQQESRVFMSIQNNKRPSINSNNKKLLYQSLQQSPTDKHKNKFQIKSIFETDKFIIDEHIKARTQLQKDKKQSKQNMQMLNFEQKKLSIYVSANAQILESQLISSYFVIVDQPGLNEGFKEHTPKQNKKLQKQDKIQKSPSKQKVQIIIQTNSDLQFKFGDLVIYCCSLISGLLNSHHQHLITMILQQNDLDKIIFGFNYLGSIRQSNTYAEEDQAKLYHAMFYQVPQQMKNIVQKIIQNAQKQQYYQNFLKTQKIDKLIEFIKAVTQYLKKWSLQSNKFKIKDESSKAEFYKAKNKTLIKAFPFKYFHYYGLNQTKFLTQISIIKRINSKFNENLQVILQRKCKIIYDQCFKQIEALFKQVNKDLQVSKQLAYLPQQYRQKVSNFYELIKQGLTKFQQFYQKIQSQYKQNLNNTVKQLQDHLMAILFDSQMKKLQHDNPTLSLLQIKIKKILENLYNSATNIVAKSLDHIFQVAQQFNSKQNDLIKQNINLNKKQSWYEFLSKLWKQKCKHSETQQIIKNIYLKFKRFLGDFLKEDLFTKAEEWNEFIRSNFKCYQLLNLDLKFQQLKLNDIKVTSHKMQQPFWARLFKIVNLKGNTQQKRQQNQEYDESNIEQRKLFQDFNKSLKILNHKFQKILKRQHDVNKISIKAYNELIYRDLSLEIMKEVNIIKGSESFINKVHKKFQQKKQKIKQLEINEEIQNQAAEKKCKSKK